MTSASFQTCNAVKRFYICTSKSRKSKDAESVFLVNVYYKYNDITMNFDTFLKYLRLLINTLDMRCQIKFFYLPKDFKYKLCRREFYFIHEKWYQKRCRSLSKSYFFITYSSKFKCSFSNVFHKNLLNSLRSIF